MKRLSFKSFSAYKIHSSNVLRISIVGISDYKMFIIIFASNCNKFTLCVLPTYQKLNCKEI